jgi:hypothetical protein
VSGLRNVIIELSTGNVKLSRPVVKYFLLYRNPSPPGSEKFYARILSAPSWGKIRNSVTFSPREDEKLE